MMIRRIKNEWFRKKAEVAQKECFGDKKVWQCVKDLQCGRRGRKPTRVVTVDDENGRLCVTVDAQKDRWRRHFNKVLNVVSVFDVSVLNRVKQRPVAVELESPPCKLEIVGALGKMVKHLELLISCQRC